MVHAAERVVIGDVVLRAAPRARRRSISATASCLPTATRLCLRGRARADRLGLPAAGDRTRDCHLPAHQHPHRCACWKSSECSAPAPPPAACSLDAQPRGKLADHSREQQRLATGIEVLFGRSSTVFCGLSLALALCPAARHIEPITGQALARIKRLDRLEITDPQVVGGLEARVGALGEGTHSSASSERGSPAAAAAGAATG